MFMIAEKYIETNFNISFKNKGDRQSPYHKHFRIYDNKDYIPQTDKKSVGNHKGRSHFTRRQLTSREFNSRVYSSMYIYRRIGKQRNNVNVPF